MYDCARCKAFACESGNKDNMPDNCPMANSELYSDILKEYIKEENSAFFVSAAEVEAEGYTQWNRVRETIEICKKMGYRDIGLAFCSGFVKEAKLLINILEKHGLTVHSVICKNGGIDKCDVKIPDEAKIDPGFEAACNPVGQARLLAEEKVDFAIVLGLCVGHDSMFYKYFARYSDAFCTTLAVKDRVTGHNPCAALYLSGGYFADKFGEI